MVPLHRGLMVCVGILGAAAGATASTGDAAEGQLWQWPRHGHGEIVLDSRIRDWVLIPIFVIMIFFTMLREYAQRALTATPKAEAKAFKETQGVWLPEAGFLRRRAYFCDKERGVFNDPNVSKSEKDPLAMMQDPNMMMQQQKSMFTVMLPQMVMMGLISFFFSGFVMVRIPVPLSLKFKSMTQRGIELQALDVSFVSSFSWYVLVSVGISGVISLLLGRQSTVNDAAAMEQQMKMGQAGQPMDTPKLYQAEQEALSMVEHTWVVDGAEDRLLAMYGLGAGA